MIELSLNEVETLAGKAARGAGFDWGLAEDIGRAAVVLARQGLDWSGALLALLEEAPGFVAPGQSGTVCPVRAAAWLNDAPPMEGLTLSGVGRPVWLAAMARGFEVETDVSAPRADVAVRPLARREAGPAVPLFRGDRRRPMVSQQRLDALGRLAARLYVPESEGSRRRGAGGGRVDDD